MKKSFIIVSHFGNDFKNENHYHQLSLPLQIRKTDNKPISQAGKATLKKSCKQCGGEVAKTGAGRRPQEISLSCSECKHFIGWFPVQALKLAKGGKN